MEKKLIDLVDKALSRRSFLAGAGTAAASTLIAGCSNGTPATTTPPATTAAPAVALMDGDYFNFALNLEYLEAEFYLRAATGSGLSAADAGTGAAAVTGGTQIPPSSLTVTQSAYLNEIAQNELDHVRLLRSVLGSYAIPRPAIDLTFFAALATVAGITTTNTFNPFTSYANYLIGAFIFEDVGVTAYHGAALVLTNKTTNLVAGAEIHAVEAYHAASIRSQIVATDALTTPSPGLTAIANKVSALRSTLGGGMETMLSSSSIVAADTTNSIGFKRSPDQVLHIVYGAGGGAGVTKGGFFPAGLNGLISATAS